MTEIACTDIVATVTAYLEGTLAEHERRLFDAHVAGCPACTEYLAQMRDTVARLGTLDETTISPQTRDGIVAAFREWRATAPGRSAQ
jgi:anti-sigma factor RsiW